MKKEDFVEKTRKAISANKAKLERLKNLDCLVFDSSLRESTVGQVRGHTLSNKFEIYDEAQRCGFKRFIVAAFSDAARVDDSFLQALAKDNKVTDNMYTFSEVPMDKENVPAGLTKMKTYGIRNPIFEIDLANAAIFEGDQAISIETFCDYLKHWISWSHNNLLGGSGGQDVLVNIRDFPFAMSSHPDRVFAVISSLASAGSLKPGGMIYEEPTGEYSPSVMGEWTAAIRECMNGEGWKDGHLLVHVHQKWGFAQPVQLECLASGANGIWAGLSDEGAALGHAGSAITLTNLWRLGNKKILKSYNCDALRSAAFNVAKITTGFPPEPKHPVYGSRALDLAFDFGGIAGGTDDNTFALAKLFGTTPPVRISTLASDNLIVKRLKQVFGEDDQFTLDIAAKMHALIIGDLVGNQKKEYMSAKSLADLFERAGGSITDKMRGVINE